MKLLSKLSLAIMATLILASCDKDDPTDCSTDNELDSKLQTAINDATNGDGIAGLILPLSSDYNNIPQDPLNPITNAKVELGKLLFHETALGTLAKYENGLGTYSCASCHHAAAGFQANIIQGIGDGGQGFGLEGEGRVPNPNYSIDSLDVQPIRTPTAMNGAYQKVYAMEWAVWGHRP